MSFWFFWTLILFANEVSSTSITLNALIINTLKSIMISTVSSAQSYNEILASNNACASSTTYTSTIFNAPQNGEIIGIKAVYNPDTSQLMTCNKNVCNGITSKWGCPACSPQPSVFTFEFLKVTDASKYYGHTTYPTNITQGFIARRGLSCDRGCTHWDYFLEGQDINDDIIVFMGGRYSVTTNDQFMMQIGEACCDTYDFDNIGHVCAQIYFLYDTPTSTFSPLSSTTNPKTSTLSTLPTYEPTYNPTYIPSNIPSSKFPTITPSKFPTILPSKFPTISPSNFPTITPSKLPSNLPSKTPSKFPTNTPSNTPSYEPTIEPTNKPSEIPTKIPSQTPIIPPTYSPTTITPSKYPTITPTINPTYIPSISPSNIPTYNPTTLPTLQPLSPTYNPTYLPSINPTLSPIQSPSISPTISPTLLPSTNPTFVPTIEPTTNQPSTKPTDDPTIKPTPYPTPKPTYNPNTNKPTNKPTPVPIYMWHPTTESPTNYPTISPTNIPSTITNMPTIIPTNTPTITEEIIEPNNNNQVVYKPRQFGDIILPVTLVVLVGACALCCVVIVIIRQLCIKSQRANKKPHKYITAIQVTPPRNNTNESEKKHGPLSDTDSLDAQHIHHVHHVQPRRLKDISNAGTPTGQFVRYESGQLTIPLKKNTFCRNLQNHAGANNIMMDDIIEEINTRGHTHNTEIELTNTIRTNSNNSDNIMAINMNNKRSKAKNIIVKSGNYKPKYKYTNTYSETYNTNGIDMSTKCNYGSIERKMMDNNYINDSHFDHQMDDDAGSNDSDDTQLSKPRRHNYSTLTMKSGIAIANEIKQDINININNKNEYKYHGHGHGHGHGHNNRHINAYHEITPSGFGKLQNAITVAKTHSDFDKLEDLIKKGIIPSPNWHGKGQNYNRYKYNNNNTINELNEMEEKDYIKHNNNQNNITNDSESSLISKSESSIENNNNNNNNNIRKEILENKIVILDEDELTHKLVNVANDRKLKQKQKKKRVVRHVPIEQQYID